VTISNFIQIQQSVRRINPDPLCRHVDIDANLGGQGYQDLTATAAHDQPAPADAAFHALDLADPIAVDGFNGAADELVMIIAARFECP